jgi:flagellar capping protein FliD
MKLSGIDTIDLIEEYMKTLPDSLPVELRRSIIIRIVASSGFDFEKLVNDGIDRVTRLNEYATQFAARTDEIVTRQNAAIEDLERQISAIRAEINERKNLHKQQFLTIEDEAQRLKEILDFITK